MSDEALHFVRRRAADARRSLRKAVRSGGVTLVLGAGVSVARGLPNWTTLVRSLWEGLDPPRPAPDWMRGEAPPPHPFALQMVVEEIEGALGWELGRRQGLSADAVDPAQVREQLVQRIADRLYARERPHDPADTLGALVELLRREQRSDRRRVRQVISFNADDLLERGANRDVDPGREPVLFPVPRGSFHPRHSGGAHGRAPITVYHLHGFIPRSPLYKRAARDTLVFTDAQYWATTANPGSFANRVMGSALHETHCLFVGLSMTDVNLMRWLGLHHLEFLDDRRAYHEYHGATPAAAERRARQAIARHHWICSARDDPSRLIASHLERRGVTTVVLPSWGEPFAALLDELFAADEAADAAPPAD